MPRNPGPDTAAPARFRLLEAEGMHAEPNLAQDVLAGLSAAEKTLPCVYFYDRRGSQLFEAICALPGYYLTSAEREILEANAEEIVGALPDDVMLVEFGSGSAAKTRVLIEALIARHGRLHYVPVDISRSMLVRSAEELLRDHPGLEVSGLAGEYHAGLRLLHERSDAPMLVLWLGSNVGNFDRPAAAAFLAKVRATLADADRMLVGVDLRKDPATILAAYDDPGGVTASFNLNLLARLNRELGADFDPDRFRHRATYDEAAGRVEIRIESLADQTVRVRALELEVPFRRGETIHTEDCHKYSLEEIDRLAARASFRVADRWFDDGLRFSLNLLAPA